MSEKRFIVESVEIISDCNENKKRIAKVITDTDELYSYEDLYEIKDLLNEQQATINHLKQELGEYKENWDDMVELATKTSLRNVELDEQIGQLRKELNDCEKFRYTVFKRIGELNDERRTKRN